jgi:hypothetical protein
LTIWPEADYFGETSILVDARDGTGLNTVVEILVNVLWGQDAPEVLLAEPNITAMEDERGVEFDLTTLFFDVDGDDLTYVIPPTDHVSFIVMDDTLVVDPETDFWGTVELPITARDEWDEATAILLLVFLPVDDPPVVTSVDPVGPVTLSEGESRIFGATATDPENEHLDYDWYVDNELILADTLSRYELITDYDFQGSHLVSLRITDGVMETWVNWSVQVTNVNRIPTLTVRTPEEGDTYDLGTNVVFEAEVDDPDGETLTVEWLIDGEVVGTGYAFTTSDLDAGKHTVMVQATDPHGAIANGTVTFTVEEEGGLPGVSSTFTLVAMVLGGIVAAVWLRTSRD